MMQKDIGIVLPEHFQCNGSLKTCDKLFKFEIRSRRPVARF